MACGQLCAWNFEGKACLRPIDEICPMTNIASQGKPQTNADRIRAMSDEELVKLIGHNCLCDQIQNKDRKWCESKPYCDGCLHEWLKQPAEVDNG